VEASGGCAGRGSGAGGPGAEEGDPGHDGGGLESYRSD